MTFNVQDRQHYNYGEYIFPIPNLFEINTLACETDIIIYTYMFVSVKLLALGVDIRIRITTEAGASKFPEGKKEI